MANHNNIFMAHNVKLNQTRGFVEAAREGGWGAIDFLRTTSTLVLRLLELERLLDIGGLSVSPLSETFGCVDEANRLFVTKSLTGPKILFCRNFGTSFSIRFRGVSEISLPRDLSS